MIVIESISFQASKQRFSTKVSSAKRIGKPGPNVAAVQAVLKKMEDDKHKENAEFQAKKKVRYRFSP